MESLGEWAREAIESAGLTPAAAARRAGVSPSTVHRILNDTVDPSIGTVRELAIACGHDLSLRALPLSDADAAAAVRSMFDGAYTAPEHPGVERWHQRLPRLADAASPAALTEAAALAAAPVGRSGAVLCSGDVPLARLASAGDASGADWAISGAAGLYLTPDGEPAPATTILWCEDVRCVEQLLTDSALGPALPGERPSVAIVAAEPELFAGAFMRGIVRFAAPIQIMLDCLCQGGGVAADARAEVLSW